MAESYFIFKGTDSRNMHITCGGAAPIIRGEERAEHVTIPGRAGDLTQTEGDDIYNSYIQTVTISVAGAEHVPAALKWLSGSGNVTFSGEPDRVQGARVIGAVTLDRVSRNLDRWRGEVQFYCEPLKRDPDEADVSLGGAGSVANPGDVEARPKIQLTVTAGTMVTVISSSGTFSVDLTGRSETGIVIDSETETVTDAAGTVNLTGLSSGPFPRIAAVGAYLGGLNWSAATVTRRCRYL